ETAPWLIVVFAERYGSKIDGTTYKNYYVPESVGIASGFLISAIHQAGLYCLVHTPNPMKFLTKICNRPASNKPVMILAIGHPAKNAKVPYAATLKKPLEQILTTIR
ncbi:MAG: nitroreductase family protein, partial [Pseudomonadota bacterium]|nr:nitroreductase family protein [Pseudomonadota bacterium]